MATIPARTYFFKNDALNGQLEVERRWYMEMFGDGFPTIPQRVTTCSRICWRSDIPRFPPKTCFNAWTLASRSLPKVTELVMREWSLDFHWYPEGCWSDPGRCTGFRTIDDVAGAKGGFAGQDVAKGSTLCNIADSAAGKCNGKKSSYSVADEMEADARKALSLINTMESGGNADLEVAINNVKQMAYLSAYYAHKIRGATYKKAEENEGAGRNGQSLLLVDVLQPIHGELPTYRIPSGTWRLLPIGSMPTRRC